MDWLAKGRETFNLRIRRIATVVIGSIFVTMLLGVPAEANHSWGGYHWARASNPFTLKLGDNVGAQWDAFLSEASSDWSASTVLDTTVVAGTSSNLRRCSASQGRVEVCNASYGSTGWLGVAGISLSGGHITSGYVKLNDSYFNTAQYNKPEWRRLVTCQEIGHTLGLDHQDTTFGNANLGTCMDYTNTPLGPPSNEHPNQHDYDQLVSIYTHLDGAPTTGPTPPSNSGWKVDRSRAEHVDAHGNGTITWTVWSS